MSAYLGIDLGTSGTKSLVCRADGTILATATAEHPISHPQPGWSEQQPAAKKQIRQHCPGHWQNRQVNIPAIQKESSYQ